MKLVSVFSKIILYVMGSWQSTNVLVSFKKCIMFFFGATRNALPTNNDGTDLDLGVTQNIYSSPSICEFLDWLKSLGQIFTPTGPGQRELPTRTPIPTLSARRNRLRLGVSDPALRRHPALQQGAAVARLNDRQLGPCRKPTRGYPQLRGQPSEAPGALPAWRLSAWPQRHSPQAHAQTGRLDA